MKPKQLKSKIKQIFKDGIQYMIDDVRKKITLVKFQYEASPPGENDFCCILSDLQLFLSIEVKCHMKDDKKKNVNEQDSEDEDASDELPSESKPKIESNLIKASQQLQKNSAYMSRLHGPILRGIWGFVKCIGIIPQVINKDEVCNHCKRFILDEDILTKPGGIEQWFENTGIREYVGKVDQQMKDQAFEDVLVLFNRLVNLSCIGTQKTVLPKSWKQIQGSNHHYISAGYTGAPVGGNAVDLDFEDVLNLPHTALKVLYFNKDQNLLLTTDDILRVIFLCDYGAGK